ncbi:MAG: DUF368 domain-containing protein [Balneolaceae bacterium]
MSENNKKEPLVQLFDLTTWKEIPFLIMKGFIMGSADIVPGVSGGTMALITGIYDRLIFAIKSFDAIAIRQFLSLRIKDFFNHIHWKFFLFLGSGMVLAVFFFTRVVPLQVYMFTHAELVYGLFFGLILGSIVLLILEIDSSKRNWKQIAPLIGGTLFGFWVVTLVPADTPDTFLFLFLSGSVAISAMVLPGISGSYILLIFRKYDYILTELSLLGSSETISALMNLAPFILGMLTGIIVFTRLLSWLLKNYHTVTMMMLIGFLMGSLWVIWPYQEREYVESVRTSEQLSVSNPLVQEIIMGEHEQDGKEYRRLGGNVSESELTDPNQVVEVETVSRQLISSRPFFPWPDTDTGMDQVNKRDGLLGSFSGLFLILVISYLRSGKKKDPVIG